MKKVLLTLTMAGFAASVLAQGTVNFVNTGGTSLRAPVYGPQPGAPSQSLVGNTTAGIPAGTQVYAGAALSGSQYMAQLFAANGAGVDQNSLVAGTGPVSTFRSGSAAGFFSGATITLVGVPADAPMATVQARVWDNTSGNYATWAAADPAWRAGTIAAGVSPTLNLAAIGGGATGVNLPPLPIGIQSFNIYFIPEPTSFALAGLGAAALLIFRRRK